MPHARVPVAPPPASASASARRHGAAALTLGLIFALAPSCGDADRADDFPADTSSPDPVQPGLDIESRPLADSIGGSDASPPGAVCATAADCTSGVCAGGHCCGGPCDPGCDVAVCGATIPQCDPAGACYYLGSGKLHKNHCSECGWVGGSTIGQAVCTAACNEYCAPNIGGYCHAGLIGSQPGTCTATGCVLTPQPLGSWCSADGDCLSGFCLGGNPNMPPLGICTAPNPAGATSSGSGAATSTAGSSGGAGGAASTTSGSSGVGGAAATTGSGGVGGAAAMSSSGVGGAAATGGSSGVGATASASSGVGGGSASGATAAASSGVGGATTGASSGVGGGTGSSMAVAGSSSSGAGGSSTAAGAGGPSATAATGPSGSAGGGGAGGSQAAVSGGCSAAPGSATATPGMSVLLAFAFVVSRLRRQRPR